MKIKLLLVALVGLIVAQKMQAAGLNVIFTNNCGQEIDASVLYNIIGTDTRYPGVYDLETVKEKINPDKSKEWNVPNSRHIASFAWRKPYSAISWIVLDLKKYNIPTTGDHTIQIFIRDQSGGIGVVVDNGKKIFIQGTTTSKLPEDV
jgi:hypothetical protein